MAELDTILIKNPTKEEFQVRFNGEMYKLQALEERAYPEFLAFHIAKHLSDKMLGKDVAKLKAKNKDNPYNPLVGQMMVYDNPQRRMYLFDIFNSKEKVEACVNAYPFKGFIGEVSEYDAYVEKALAPAPIKKSKKAETEEPLSE